MSLQDDLKTMFDRYLVTDRVYLPDRPPVLSPRSKKLLDRTRAFREDVIAGPDGYVPLIQQLAAQQANRMRERLDVALWALPPGQRLCVHDAQAVNEPTQPHQDVYRFTVRQHWHRLDPDEDCAVGGPHTIYAHR